MAYRLSIIKHGIILMFIFLPILTYAQIELTDPNFREGSKRYLEILPTHIQLTTNAQNQIPVKESDLNNLLRQWQGLQKDFPDFYPELIQLRIEEIKKVLSTYYIQHPLQDSFESSNVPIIESRPTSFSWKEFSQEWEAMRTLIIQLASENQRLHHQLRQYQTNPVNMGDNEPSSIVKSLSAQLATLKSENEQLQTKLKQMEETFSKKEEEYQREIRIHSRSRLDLLTKLENKEKENLLLERRNAELVQEIKRREKEQEQLTESLALREGRIQSLEKQIQIMHSMMAKMQAQEDVTSSLAILGEEIKKSQILLEEYRINHQKLYKQIRNQQAQLDILQINNEQLRQTILNLQRQDTSWLIKELRDALQSSEAEKLKLKNELISLQRRYHILLQVSQLRANPSIIGRSIPFESLQEKMSKWSDVERKILYMGIEELSAEVEKLREDLAFILQEQSQYIPLDYPSPFFDNSLHHGEKTVKLSKTLQEMSARRQINDIQRIQELYRLAKIQEDFSSMVKIWNFYIQTLPSLSEQDDLLWSSLNLEVLATYGSLQKSFSSYLPSLFWLWVYVRNPTESYRNFIFQGLRLIEDSPEFSHKFIESYLEVVWLLLKNQPAEQKELILQVPSFLLNLKPQPIHLLKKWYSKALQYPEILPKFDPIIQQWWKQHQHE